MCVVLLGATKRSEKEQCEEEREHEGADVAAGRRAMGEAGGGCD